MRAFMKAAEFAPQATSYGLECLIHGGSQLPDLVEVFLSHRGLSDGFASDVVQEPHAVGLNAVPAV